MAALATLATTTLSTAVEPNDSAVILASLEGITPGLRLYVDQELMGVRSIGIGTTVHVFRGVDGTATTRHASSRTVTIGRADQFYDHDPIGPPPAQLLVTPWINVLTGAQWTAQGDETGADAAGRWWAKTEHTHGVGSLGVRTTTAAASTVTVT
jgi:hypothetical protein